jgi:hypothetical protein
MVAKNQSLRFFSKKIEFQPNFYPKHIENTLEIMINLLMTLKQKPKKHRKNRNQPKNKNLPELSFIFHEL